MTRELLIGAEINKREEIVKTFNKNYLLEAGAGAGKTSLIVQRIINHIIEEDIDPANLVAITFTKAASMELAERIELKALECLQVEEDPGVIRRLKAVDRIFTGTIHSFCQLILREMPFDAGLTPNYKIIEEEEDFHQMIWNNFLRDKEEDYREKIDLLRLFNIDFRDLKTQAILALKNPDIDFRGFEKLDDSFADIEKGFKKIKEEHDGLSVQAFKNNSNLAKLFRAILDDWEDLGSYIGEILREVPKMEATIDASFEKLIAKKFWEDERAEDYRKFISSMKDLHFKINGLAYNTSTDFINMVVKYKRENYQGKLSFNELLYKASSLIKESEEARNYYRKKYRCFYIDEFQDTDPMQAELILHLTNDKRDEASKWEDMKPLAGSLFVVGDPKQSIYRFRRADISIYNKVKDIIDRNGELVYLDINFRSTRSVCDWIEESFKDQEGFGFKSEATDSQAAFERILSIWDDGPEPASGKDLQGIYKYQALDLEEEYVASMIEGLLKDYYLIDRKKLEGGEEGSNHFQNLRRRIEYGDIMILTKSNRETGIYLRALKSRGIPALLAGEKNLGDCRELMNLYILIDGIVDHMDDIKMVSILRNSFYLDLDTINILLEEKRNLSSLIFNRKAIEDIPHPSLKRAFLDLNEIMESSREYKPIPFLEKLIDKRVGIYDRNKDYRGLELRDVESALMQAMEILRSKDCASIYQVREELGKLVNSPVNYELPISREETDNAIRIMNIHKAKGLEASIVFLVGGDKTRTSFGDSHYTEMDENNKNLGYMVYRSDHGISCPQENDRRLREREFKEAEVDRLLYVAATRAKSVLLVAEGEKDKLFLDPLTRMIEREIVWGQPRMTDQVEKNTTFEKRWERDMTRKLWIKKEITRPSYLKTSPSNFQHQGEGSNDIELISPGLKAFKAIYPAEKIDKYRGPRGKTYGNIVHRALEILIKRSKWLKKADQDMIDYSVRLAINESLDGLEMNRSNLSLLYSSDSKCLKEIEEINQRKGEEFTRRIVKAKIHFYLEEVLTNFINNEDILAIFQEAEIIITELPFSIGLGKEDKDLLEDLEIFLSKEEVAFLGEEEKTILINGVMDLLIKTKAGNWLIVDYKSDVYGHLDLDRRLRERYSAQLRAYGILFKVIMKDLSGELPNIEDLFLYSTFKNRLISLGSKTSMSC